MHGLRQSPIICESIVVQNSMQTNRKKKKERKEQQKSNYEFEFRFTIATF